MSQRLLISLKENVCEADNFFDAIYTEEGNLDVLLYDWCGYVNGHYVGPWKITIRDQYLMDKFMGDFILLKQYIPDLQSFDDVWAIYEKGKLVHLSEKQDKNLKKIIKTSKEQENG